MTESKDFSAFSTPSLSDFSFQVKGKMENGFEFINGGMSMGALGPVWWAIMIRPA